MRSPVYIRPYRDSDKKLFLEYLHASRKQTNYDPELFLRNQVKIWVAYDVAGIISFFTTHLAIVHSASGRAPDVDDGRFSRALDALQHVIVERAYELNVPDIMIAPDSESYSEFLQKKGSFKKAHEYLVARIHQLEPKPVVAAPEPDKQ